MGRGLVCGLRREPGDALLSFVAAATKLGASRRVPATAASTAVFAGALWWRLGQRGGLDPDELHTLLLGKLMAGGAAPGFYVGSVTRYEGGSWLIGWPVAAALRLGATDLLAGPLVAALVAVVGVALATWGLARREPAGAALLGPLLALSPDVLHYGIRAWGSLPEALLAWPVLALLHARWRREGSAVGGLLLGAALGAGCVFSYLHLVTAGALVAWHARDRGWTLAVGAAAVLLGWWALAVPWLQEALAVRGGLPLIGLLGVDALRWDRLLVELPAAWTGGRLEPTPIRLVSAAALAVLGTACAVRVGRRPGHRPALAVTAALVPALAASHAMLGPPENSRYYLPLVVALLAWTAAAGWRPAFVAVVLSLGVWSGAGPVVPRPSSLRAFAELGANGQHRYHEDPHIKAKALWSVASGPQRRWLLYGYGVDSGRRYGAVVRSMRAKAREVGESPADLARHPHFRLLDPSVQIDWVRPLTVAEGRDAFLSGLGVGFSEDGQIDAAEQELIAVAGDLGGAIRGGVDGVGGPLGSMRGVPLLRTPEPAQSDQGRQPGATQLEP